NNVGNEIKKQNLYESNETKAHLFNSIFELLFSVHNAYIDVLNKYKPNSISCLNEVSIKKSESLFDNIRKNRIDNSQLKEKLLDVLTINPYYTEAYLYYYNKYNDTDGVLEKTALFFGIDIVSEKKIAELKRQIELNTTKMDVNEKINFANNYSKKIGLQKNINLSNSLVVQDKQQRTFNGV
ncbi:hypothetical protein, partial [Alkanindiges hydrocarboniclasticus]|uniref:hypothetical protein n=1 Tax=Alkanindiges hydrocarboniclasticus TaxID=1907941 RepID=UPI00130166F7